MNRISKILDNTQAALIYTPINRRYLTGFASSLGYLFITKSSAVLLVDGRYYLAAKSEVIGAEVLLLTDASKQLSELVKKASIDTVFVEDLISVAELEHLKKLLNLVTVESNKAITEKLTELRSIKSEVEIERIVKAQRIAEKAFSEILNFIKPGVTEKRLATELEYKMKLYGSEREAFDTIVVSGYKSAMPHGVPDDKVIADGEFVTFDFGAVYDGYHSDMTRTVAIGHATEEMVKVYNTVLSANTLVEGFLKSGVSCSDADKVARTVIEDAGYGEYFTHSTGHSLGLEIHESPSLSPKSLEVLKTGQIVTDEPGIYIEDMFGVRIEDMLLITENGCKNLTQTDKSLIII